MGAAVPLAGPFVLAGFALGFGATPRVALDLDLDLDVRALEGRELDDAGAPLDELSRYVVPELRSEAISLTVSARFGRGATLFSGPPAAWSGTSSSFAMGVLFAVSPEA